MTGQLSALAQGKSTGAAYPGLLIKTGQTVQYDSKLDDGYYESGLAKSYTVLTAGQYSGTTNITLNSITDAHSNNCVLDNNTGLMWSRYLSATLGPNSNGTLPWTTNANGEGIFDYCAAANAASLAGYTDWRIPNRAELYSLAITAAASGSMDGTAFPSMSGYIWSSTTRPNSTGYALRLEVAGSDLTYSVKSTAIIYALLVRGG